MKKHLLFLFITLLISGFNLGQSSLISPTGDGGFETGTSFAANGWTLVNGTPTATQNQWYLGIAATAGIGSGNVAYITNNTATGAYAYTNNSAQYIVHFYRDVTFPAGETKIIMSFTWKGVGETTAYDGLQVSLAPTSITPAAASTAPSGSVSTAIVTGATYVGNVLYYNQSTAATATFNIPASVSGNSVANSTMRVIFTFRMDGSLGTSPATAIDNISLTSAAPSPLNGSYSINNTLPTTTPMVHDGTGNFNNFTDAINYLNADGITAAVTFNVVAGQTFNEKPPAITATGTITNTITFLKNGGAANPKITPVGVSISSPYDFGVCIAGGDYITWDGIDIDASGATSTTTAIEFGFLVRNASATNGSQYNTIKNCAIKLNKNYIYTTGGIGSCIFSTVNSTGGGVIPTNATGANSYNKYYNLTLQNAQNGVYLLGNTTYPDLSCEVGVAGSGCQSARNSITNMGGIYTFYGAYGVYASAQNGVKIFNNDITNISPNQSAGAGILLVSYLGTSEIYNNKVGAVAMTGSTTTTSRAVGIELQNSSGTPTVRVYNNFVYGITSSFTSTATASIYAWGIYANNTTTATVDEIDNNSVYLSAAGTPTYSFACYGVANASTAVHKVRGNIFVNAVGAQGATAKHVCWYSTSATAIGGTGSISNYNDLYVTTDVGTSGHVGRGNVTNYNTVANWTTATTQDAASVSVDPGFTSATDLHASAAGVNAVSGFSTQTWVTTDIDCNDRSLTSPSDLGADAFTINDQTSKAEAPTSQVSAGNVASTVTTVGSAVDVFRFKITDMGSGDGLATKVTNIRIQNANPVNSASWTANIAGLKLNDGTSDITIGTPTITASYIDIPITSGNLDVADASSKTIAMSVYLNTSGIEDGKKLQFTISQTSHGWSAHGSGSLFAADFGAAVTSDIFTLDVTATKLVISAVTGTIFKNTNFGLTVSATDANGNTDLGNTSSVTLAKNTGTGVLSSATGLVQPLGAGVYSWTDVQYDKSEVFKIQADASGLAQAVTGNLNCYSGTANTTATIGAGTSSQSYPFDVYYGYSRNAALYTSAQIGNFGTISKLAWNVATSQTTNCPVKIYLKTQTSSTVASDTWANYIAGATLVYDATRQFSSTGWNEQTLTSTFDYTSGNLLVLTEGNYTGGGISSYPSFYYTTTTNQNANARADNSPPISVTVGSSLPDIQITLAAPFMDQSFTSSTTTQNVTSVVVQGSTNQQIIGMQVVTNGSSSPLTADEFDFTLSGTTAPADIANATIYYTGTSGTFAATTPFDSDNTINTLNPGDPFIMTGSQALQAGTNYFWLAYDIAGSATINNYVDANCDVIKVSGTNHTPDVTNPGAGRQIKGPLAGDITVGTAKGTYTTLTAAINDLNLLGISDNVNFILTDATYTSETFPIVINSVVGASSSKKVTIKPNASVAATISGSSATALLKLYGADFVTIDGLNTGGSSLTFNNSNASGVDLWISSTPTDGATYNVVKNCTFLGNAGTTTIAGVIAGSGTTLGNAAETANSNNTIQYNIFKSTQNGVYISGYVTAPYDENWIVSNNTFGSTVPAEKHGFRGMFIGNASNFTVSNNTIIGVLSTTSSSSTMSGIQVGLAIAGGKISSNIIGNISQINTTGWGANGIYLAASTAASAIDVYNNVIYDVTGYGYAGTLQSDNGYGIMIQSGGGYNLYYNSVNMYTSQTSATGIPAAINISSAITTVGSIKLQNNIFNIPSSNTAGTRYAIYCGAANTVFTDINYNDYYSVGTFGYLGSAITTLAAWKTATEKDANSISTDPLFASAVNLTPASEALRGAGTDIPGITVDYNNDPRSNPPDIGAINVPCVNPTAGGTIGTAQSACGGFDPEALTSTAPASGGAGILEYKWQESITGSTSGFSDIASSNSETFDPPAIIQTTWYKRLARVACKPGWADAAESNVVEMTVIIPAAPTAGNVTTNYDGLPHAGSATPPEGSSVAWYDAATEGNLLTDPPTRTNVGSATAWAESVDNLSGCTSAARTEVTVTINKAPLTIGGTFTAFNKVYDGNTDAAINDNSLTLVTPVTGEDVSLTTIEFDFANGSVGTGKTVSITSALLTGADADNYTLSLTGAPTTMADITPVTISLKVMLQGPYDTGTGFMKTDLYTGAQIPTGQPYGVAPWNYTGGETATPVSTSVDWVLVELRSDISTMVARFASLLNNDGTVSISISDVDYPGIHAGSNYFIVVWHRNHMPVMSAGAQTMPVSSYDFTQLANLYGTNPAINLGGGIYGMIAGDVTKNGKLKYSGTGNDRGPIIAKIIATPGGTGVGLYKTLTDGYWFEDTNLDNYLSYLPGPNDRGIIIANLNTLVSPSLNSIYTSVVPGATSGKDAGKNDGPFDIQLAEFAPSITINLITNETIENGLVDNIQFTLAWKAEDTEIAELLSSFTSDFMLAPQGEAFAVNGVMHQVYVSVTPVNLPIEFNEGDPVTVMSFDNSTGQTVTGRLWIADDDFTAENNAMYYVSVWGNDFTGMIQTIATGLNEIPAAGSVSIYPNPVVNGMVNIAINIEGSQDVTITLMDMQGKTISGEEINTTAGLSIHTFDLKGVGKGVYFIRISGDNLNIIEKLVIQSIKL